MPSANPKQTPASSAPDLYASFGFYIAGEWRRPANLRWLEVIDPATEAAVGRIPCAGKAELADAVQDATDAFELWRKVHPWERSAVLRRTAEWLRNKVDDCALTLSQEQGKPIAEAKREFGMAADHFEWAAEEAKRIYGQIIQSRPSGSVSHVRHEPIGVVAAFTPWNFPALQVASKVAYAVAAGCTVVIKPSEETPGAAMKIVQALHESGLPAGVVNLVVGDPAEISTFLLAEPAVKAMSFTGSTAVGKTLMGQAAKGLKRVTLELGGHAPLIVLADADPRVAAEKAAMIKFRNAGQACVSPSRFYVHESIASAFADHLVAYAKKLVVGPGIDAATTMGPMANERRVKAATELVDDAVRKGAKVLVGGRSAGGTGYYFLPTVLTGVTQDSRIMNEEPFAPIAPITTFTDEAEVVGWANRLPYGLAAYVFSGSTTAATRVAGLLEAGMVGVNNFALAMAETPFGGVKESGFGREGGPSALSEFLVPKLIKIEEPS